jgi:acyl carrier protein
LGYEQRPVRTPSTFVKNPFSAVAGERLYRTGDVGRRRTDGSLEYLGRRDGRLILNGMRVEAGAIEAALVEHPAVCEAAVMPRNETSAALATGISAWAVARDGQMVTGADLRRFLQERLPETMVPETVTVVDVIPRTSQGKVDLRALAVAGKTIFTAPKTPTERTIADIWMELMHLDQVGVHDSFFSLGDHSLLATQLVSRIGHALRVEVSLRQLFEAPTIAELARIIEQVI